MMQKTEQLLEQLLNNADEQREYLKNVLEALNGNPPNGGGGGGPNGGNNNREEKKTFNEFLKQYSASAKQIAEGALKISGAMTSADPNAGVSGLLGGIDTISSAIGGLVPELSLLTGTVSAVVQLAAWTWDVLNKNLARYQDLNAAGVGVEDGMFHFSASAASANLAIDSFATVMKQNSDIVAGLSDDYVDTVNTIGEFIGSVNQAQLSMGMFGLSQEQVADLTLKYTKALKIQNALNPFQLQSEAMTTQTAEYIKNITALGKVAGQSVDEIMKKNLSVLDTVDGAVVNDKLVSMLGDVDGQKAFDGLTNMFNSMGPSADIIRDAFFDYFATGGKLPDDLSQFSDLPNLFADMKRQIETGTTTTTEGIVGMLKQFQNFAGSNDFAQGLANATLVNKEAGNKLAKFRNQMRLMDPDAVNKNIVGPWDSFITNLRTAWSKSFEDISKKFYTSLDLVGAGFNSALTDYQSGKIDFVGLLDSWITSAAAAIGNMFAGVDLDALADTFVNFKDSMISGIENIFLSDTGPGLIEMFGGLFGKLTIFLGNILYKTFFTAEGIKQLASYIIKIPGMICIGIYDFLVGIAKSFIGSTGDKNAADSFAESAQDVRNFLYHGVVDGLIGFFSSPVDYLKNMWNTYKPYIISSINAVGDSVTAIVKPIKRMINKVAIAINNSVDDAIKYVKRYINPLNWGTDEPEDLQTVQDGNDLITVSPEDLRKAQAGWNDLTAAVSSWWNDDSTPTQTVTTPKGVNKTWNPSAGPIQPNAPTLPAPKDTPTVTEQVLEKKRVDLADPTSQPNMDKRHADLLSSLLNNMTRLAEIMESVKDGTNRVANNTDPVVNT